MNRCTVLTDIKQELQENRHKQYTVIQQSNLLKHYTLYIPQVVLIQRNFRKYLCQKTKRLQYALIDAVDEHICLAKQAKQIQQKKIYFEKQRNTLKEFDLQQAIQKIGQQLQENVQRSVSSLLNTGQQLARSNATVKALLVHNRKLKEQQGELIGEVQSLKFQQQCYLKKKEDWEKKKASLRSRITDQSAKRLQLEWDYKRVLGQYVSHQNQKQNHNLNLHRLHIDYKQ